MWTDTDPRTTGDLRRLKNCFALAVGMAAGVVAADQFPLLRHVHRVLRHDEPVDMPWDRFYRRHR